MWNLNIKSFKIKKIMNMPFFLEIYINQITKEEGMESKQSSQYIAYQPIKKEIKEKK